MVSTIATYILARNIEEKAGEIGIFFEFARRKAKEQLLICVSANSQGHHQVETCYRRRTTRYASISNLEGRMTGLKTGKHEQEGEQIADGITS